MTGDERLLLLADKLDSVPPESFNIDSWHCGTAACAVGHACMMPEFNREGLTLGLTEDNRGFPQFQDLDCWSSVISFFELDSSDGAFYLFAGDKYLDPNIWSLTTLITAKMVADRIRKFVADRNKTVAQIIKQGEMPVQVPTLPKVKETMDA